MYALHIVAADQEEVIKICSSKHKAEELAIDNMLSYFKENKNLIKRKPYLFKEIEIIKEAILVKEISSAIDLFGLLTDKLKKHMILSIARAEIMHDA